MDHYRDLTEHTTTAANTIRQKAQADAARMVADFAIGTVWNALDADTKERLYGLLEQS